MLLLNCNHCRFCDLSQYVLETHISETNMKLNSRRLMHYQILNSFDYGCQIFLGSRGNLNICRLIGLQLLKTCRKQTTLIVITVNHVGKTLIMGEKLVLSIIIIWSTVTVSSMMQDWTKLRCWYALYR